jgi:hypothetical protein
MVMEKDMPREFKKPSFEDRQIELRYDNDEICIYATRAGLERIITFCKYLLEHPKRGSGHVHLEDYELLTNASLKGVIALFDD